jgi:hypothetical protein
VRRGVLRRTPSRQPHATFTAGVGDGQEDGRRFLLGLGAELFGRGIRRHLLLLGRVLLGLLPLLLLRLDFFLQAIREGRAEGRVGAAGSLRARTQNKTCLHPA